MEMEPEKSSTGGLDGPDDQKQGEMTAIKPGNESQLISDDESSPQKKKKLQVNSGQVESKIDEENLSGDQLDDIKRSSVGSKSNFSTLQVLSTDEKARFDRNGNPITTSIGRFHTGAMRKSMKASTRKSLNSDTGAADLASPEKVDPKKRHRVTFMDDVSGDKNQLTEIHLIESYKKYNQEFYIENQVQGCCTIF